MPAACSKLGRPTSCTSAHKPSSWRLSGYRQFAARRGGDDGVRLGPLRLPLGTTAAQGATARRVQVLIRPENTVLARSAKDLDVPTPVRAWWTRSRSADRSSGYVCGFRHCLECGRSRRRRRSALPTCRRGAAIRGCCRAAPLSPGDRAWVGVRRFHALTHPGLRMLLAVDGTPDSAAVLDVGGTIARLAHARTTVLAYGSSSEQRERVLQAAREQIGAGLPALESIGQTVRRRLPSPTKSRGSCMTCLCWAGHHRRRPK